MLLIKICLNFRQVTVAARVRIVHATEKSQISWNTRMP